MATKRKAASKRTPRKKPESLRLRRMSVSLTVGDLEKSLAWYRDLLGFTISDSWERDGKVSGVELKAGEVYLVINQDDWARGRDRVKGEGFRLYLSTAQDVDQIAALIKSRGGTLASEPADMPWGTRSFGMMDPDGFKLTISSWE